MHGLEYENEETFMKNHILKIWQFMNDDIWDINLKSINWFKKIAISFLRVLSLIWHGIHNHILLLHAAALTYISLMSMVPILALMFSISKGLGAQTALRDSIDSWLSSMPDQVQTFVETIFSYVDKTNFGVLGTFGLLFLLYASVSLLSSIEKTFNGIWGVQQSRKFFRKFMDYTSVIFIVPILIISATSVSASLQSDKLMLFLQNHIGLFFQVYEKSIVWTSRVIIWVAFTFLYLFMPNKKVKFIPCFIGGIFAGECWQLIQWIYIHFQLGIARYNAIYGVFAVIPIFLAWLYLVWIDILLGAEISYSIQNYSKPFYRKKKAKTNFATYEQIGIWICFEVMQQFSGARGSWSVNNFLEENDLNIDLVQPIIDQLIDHEILAQKQNSNEYLPARDLSELTLARLSAILKGKSELPHQNSVFDQPFLKKMDEAEGIYYEHLNQKTLKEYQEFAPSMDEENKELG